MDQGLPGQAVGISSSLSGRFASQKHGNEGRARKSSRLEAPGYVVPNSVVEIIKQKQRITPMSIVHQCKSPRKTLILLFPSEDADFSLRKAHYVDGNWNRVCVSSFIYAALVAHVNSSEIVSSEPS